MEYGIPLDGMNAEIDALLNKIQKHSDKFVKDQPLVFKFDKGSIHGCN